MSIENNYNVLIGASLKEFVVCIKLLYVSW